MYYYGNWNPHFLHYYVKSILKMHYSSNQKTHFMHYQHTDISSDDGVTDGGICVTFILLPGSSRISTMWSSLVTWCRSCNFGDDSWEVFVRHFASASESEDSHSLLQTLLSGWLLSLSVSAAQLDVKDRLLCWCSVSDILWMMLSKQALETEVKGASLEQLPVELNERL